MVFKILHVVLLASVKYFLTIPYALLIGLSYGEALLAVLAGGIGGFLFFYYLSGWIIKRVKLISPVLIRLIPTSFRLFYRRKLKVKEKKIFSWRSRLIAKIKNNYGLWGIVISTPVFLTIPLGAFLANKYYSRKKHIVAYMLLSITGWAILLTSLTQVFPGVF